MSDKLISIYNFFKGHGYNWNRFEGDYGLEIETETQTPYDIPPFAFWNVHPDGSLRNFGQEYVMKQPLKFPTSLNEALVEFKSKTKEIKFIENSITTSVHVHINFLNHDVQTLSNFLTAYALVENILVRFAGENRISNGFCLPICDAEETYQNIVFMLQNIFNNKRYGNLFFDDAATKYAGLNIASLGIRGSLEIRLFRGTTDTELIQTWVRILNRLVEYAKDPKRYPNEIITNLKNKETKILEDIFLEDYKLLKHANEKDLLEKNMFYAANIGLVTKDWAKALSPFSKDKKKIKPNDIDKFSKQLFGVVWEDLNGGQQREVMNFMQRDEGLQNLNPALGNGNRPRRNRPPDPWQPAQINMVDNHAAEIIARHRHARHADQFGIEDDGHEPDMEVE